MSYEIKDATVRFLFIKNDVGDEYVGSSGSRGGRAALCRRCLEVGTKQKIFAGDFFFLHYLTEVRTMILFTFARLFMR